MVQILEAPERRKGFMESLMSGVAEGLPNAIQQFQQYNQQQQQQQRQQQLMQRENQQIMKNWGADLSGVVDPKTRQIIVSELLKQGAPAKPLNPLQQSQKALTEARIKDLEGTGGFFNEIMGAQGGQGDQETSPDQMQDINQQIMEGPEQQTTQQPQGFDISKLPEDTLRKISGFKGQPGKKGVIGNIAQTELDRRKEENLLRTKKEIKYFEMNEPELKKIAETERKLDIENARFGRLQELFSDTSKFPSSLIASLFSKEGQINDIAYSQLSPEAQEAVKLIIDSTSGIKDTYGARVTNFDLQTYLRKLPSLLNSPEGRERVLRDLMSINDINQLYNRGIQDVFDSAGGSDKIPFSEAEKRFKQKYGKELNQKLKDFTMPEKKKFDEKPDAKKYLGKKIKDAETGEIFISDGVEWKLFGG